MAESETQVLEVKLEKAEEVPGLKEAAEWVIQKARGLDTSGRLSFPVVVRVAGGMKRTYHWTATCFRAGKAGRNQWRVSIAVRGETCADARDGKPRKIKIPMGAKQATLSEKVAAKFDGTEATWSYIYEEVEYVGGTEIAVYALSAALWYVLRKCKSVKDENPTMTAANKEAVKWLAEYREARNAHAQS